jgi:hypothetical protein
VVRDQKTCTEDYYFCAPDIIAQLQELPAGGPLEPNVFRDLGDRHFIGPEPKAIFAGSQPCAILRNQHSD